MTLAILTPSYRPDLERLRRLHRSVLEHTDSDVVHHVIVPRSDLDVFGDLVSSRFRLWSEADFLPPGFVLTDGFADFVRRFEFLPAKARVKAVNMRRPWPPVRGWILQQIVKLQAATRLDADVVAVIDSDVVLIRDVNHETFVRNSAVRLYRNPHGITPAMDRHVRWETAASRLLGVGTSVEHPDYIAGLVTWDPVLVADCLKRVDAVASGEWATAVGSELHFSEFMLYGSFVHELGTPRQNSFVSDRTLCHSYWEPSPMDMDDAIRFVSELDEVDVAVHVQSNSRTPPEVEDFIFRRAAAI
jgi:hypothetical protein